MVGEIRSVGVRINVVWYDRGRRQPSSLVASDGKTNVVFEGGQSGARFQCRDGCLVLPTAALLSRPWKPIGRGCLQPSASCRKEVLIRCLDATAVRSINEYRLVYDKPLNK